MNRKTIIRKLVAVAAFAGLLCAVDVGIGYAAEATATVGGTVVTPLSITKDVNMQFGSFAVETAGTVILTTAGVVSTTDGAQKYGSTPVPAAAQFTVRGEAGAGYTISIADTTLTHLTDDPMALDTFTVSHNGGTALSATLPSGTGAVSDTLLVGGTVHVAGNQASGVYSGTITVTVNYN